ncbi:phage head-tail connector protein [Azospirillum sp.]|uniref:phage head-tail connector protein n=1 Tax=Azospirillum sp. TaxID=34012 RepID=UPI002D73C45D|nr:phage head-tail connector protein [Azospirillum sp.]HYF88980.1 phage head-tail connector protein [Azospirillum sp.]
MLTTLAKVKAELQSPDADDTLLTTLIEQASATIETFCGRSFAAAAATETYRIARWRERLILERTPVVSVASVLLNGETLDPAAYEVESPGAGFLLRLDGSGCSIGWPAGRVAVTYTAGYSATPPDVERCCIDVVKLGYFARCRDPMLRSYENPDVERMSWTDPDKVVMRGGLPADIADRLDAYRTMVIG